MIKRMTLLARREGLDVEAFRRHWAGPHAALAMTMPGVCKYTQNRVDEVLWGHPGSTPFRIDGIVELFFSDEAAMARDQASETGRRLIPEDEPTFLHGWTLCIVDSPGPHDRAGAKVLLPLALQPDVDRTIVAAALEKTLSDSGSIGFANNAIVRHAKRERLWHEPVAPDLIAVCWFQDPAAARNAFRPDGGPVALLQSTTQKASACLCDPLTIA